MEHRNMLGKLGKLVKLVSIAFILASFSTLAKQTDNSFLPMSSLSAAQIFSSGICSSEGCNSKTTVYWLPILTLSCSTLGTFWIEVQPSGPYGVSLLTPTQQSSLRTYSSLSSDNCFPVN